MFDHCHLLRLRALAVLLAVVLLMAGAAAADIESPRHSTFTITSHPVPAGQAGPDVAPGTSSRTPVSSSYVVQGERAAEAGEPVIASVSPRIASAGTSTTVTITGTGFGTKASRTSPADVGFIAAGGVYWASGRTSAANPDDILSWSDTEVRVRVPTGSMEDGQDVSASSGSIRIVTDANRTSNAVPFAVSFGVTGTKWAAGPVFLVNDNCPGTAGGAAAVRRAAATWNAALPPGHRIDCSGATMSTTDDYDGVSLIAWGSSPGATIWYNESTGAIVEADIILDADLDWTTGTAGGSVYSVEALTLQALGYGLGIASLSGAEPQGPSDTGKVCSRWRGDDLGNMNLIALSPADRAAASYLYNGGSSNPPLLAAAFTTDRIAGPAPLSVQFGDTSIGGATGWMWEFGDGETSTERNPVHTYAAPGTYTVALTSWATGYPDDTIRAVDRIAVADTALQVVPGGTAAPTDTNGDGKYDDINGNGRTDFADVVLFFTQMSWIAENEPLSAFDYNANGRVDFADVVRLFGSL